jgi:acetyl esterase/lipase/lysophospholipase L1-like esterase
MKKIILSIALTLITLTSMAQSTARKFIVNVTPDGASTLISFLPAADKATGKAVVICPGGGYGMLCMDYEGTNWSEFFNSKGIACFVLKYRLPHGDRSLPFSDAENSIKILRDSAAVWHLNPYDIGIMGSSAGGHLASTISTHADYAHRPNFSILFYPVISMDPKKGHAGSTRNLFGKDKMYDKDLIQEYSNDKQVVSHLTPPAIILMTNDDVAVPPVTNGVAYYAAMRNCGNDCAMYIYPTGNHGFGYRSDFKYHDQMLGDLTKWLEELPSPKSDAVRVACIGNSITDGARIDMKDLKGYPAQLQQILGAGYNVKNFGVSGCTMLKKGNFPYMNRLAWRDAQAFNPNIVVIKLGTNDSKAVNWQYGVEFKQDMQSMIDTLKLLPSKPKIYLALPIVANCEVKDEGSINNEVIEKEIIPIIYKVAKKNKLKIIDMRDDMNREELLSNDGIHPNVKGAGVMAKDVATAITQ